MPDREYKMYETCKHWNENYWCEEFDEGRLPYEFACERWDENE